MEASGICVSEFENIKSAFEDIFNDPQERGGGLCIKVGDETVVNLWAGSSDLEESKPWHEDTLVNTFCVVKPFAAVAALMLVEKGVLELDIPVAHYWPEFAQGGKDTITLRHVMNHTSGIPALRLPDRNPAMYDWEQMINTLAAEPVWWQPGTELGYGTLTYGWIIGELIRRTDGRDPCTFIHEEITQPNGLEVHLGVEQPDYYRIARFYAAKGRTGDPYSQNLRASVATDSHDISTLAFTNPGMSPKRSSDPRWWAFKQPGACSHSTANGLAGFYSALLAGRLISAETLNEFIQEQSNGMDRIWKRPMRYGLGCMLEQQVDPHASHRMGPNTFGHIGLGGPIAFADADRGISFSFVTTTSGAHAMIDPRAQNLAALAYAAV